MYVQTEREVCSAPVVLSMFEIERKRYLMKKRPFSFLETLKLVLKIVERNLVNS
jgi:hypothetical protein